MDQPIILISKYGKTGKAKQPLTIQPNGTHTLPELLETSDVYQAGRYKDKADRNYSLQMNITDINEAQLHKLIDTAVGTGHVTVHDMELVALKTTVTRRVKAAPPPQQQPQNAAPNPAPGPADGPAPAPAADNDDEEEENIPRGFAQLGQHDVRACTSLMQSLIAPVQRALEQDGDVNKSKATLDGLVRANENELKMQFNRIATSYNGGTAISADLFSQVNINVGLGQIMGSLLDPNETDHQVANAILTFIQNQGGADEKMRLISTLTLSDMVQQHRPGVAKELLMAAQQEEISKDRPLTFEGNHQLQLQLVRLDVLNLQKQVELQEQRRREEVKQQGLRHDEVLGLLRQLTQSVPTPESAASVILTKSISGYPDSDTSMSCSRAPSPPPDHEPNIKVENEPIPVTASDWHINVHGENTAISIIDVSNAPQQLQVGTEQLNHLLNTRTASGSDTNLHAHGQNEANIALMKTTLDIPFGSQP